MTVHFHEFDATLYRGDAVEILKQLPSDSVNCVLTSPPYYGLRDYGTEGQIGLEGTPAAYVEALRAVFAEVRRVIRPDGVLWLNLGDSYSGKANAGSTFDRHRGQGHRAGIVAAQRNNTAHAPYKSLLGIPWRVAFGLVDDGWILRNEVIWHKPNAMPESVTDRLSSRHESLFMFSRSPRYWFDLDPIRERLTRPEALAEGIIFGGSNKAADLTTGSSARRTGSTYGKTSASNLAPTGQRHTSGDDAKGKNPGDVWSISTQPYRGAHFATMAPALAERCILAGCPAGGTVLDPFAGSGTSLMVARQLGRKGIGIDLKAEYLDLAVKRLGPAPMNLEDYLT